LLVVGFALLALLLMVFLVGFFAHSWTAPDNQHDGGWDGPPYGLILVVIVIILIVRFLRRTAAPIGDVMDAAERVSAGDYSARVVPRGTRSARRLAASFNEMAAKLERNEEQRRRLLADVTHEMRTPLSVIRGNLEGMLDGVYARDDEHISPIVDETKQMARLLDDLHTLATAEAGELRLHREPTNVSELIGDVIAAYTPRATERGIQLTRDVAASGEFELDPMRIRQVLENLIANSLRYTPSGGRITVGVRRQLDGLEFSVSDTGTGVPADALPHLFDRFTKSADSGGSGLGLAIARSLVEAHGGTIDAASPLGAGLTVRFVIPVSAGGN
jgi:two-component system OmpR family sensor kinase/two-component system sensor histidine kinase BaeS